MEVLDQERDPMKTNISYEALSDGKLYDINDLVKADTEGCGGCSACCHGVGEWVELTPFDMYAMTRHLKMSFEELFEDHLEMRPNGKLLLPTLKMNGTDERCSFLNTEGRCAIHSARPNICRLFPLGRVYDQGDFKFFLMVGACIKPKLAKVKVKKWIGIEDYAVNKAFILAWYQLLKALEFRLKFIREEQELEAIRKDIIDTFYRMAPDTDDFYGEFNRLLPEAKKRMGIL